MTKNIPKMLGLGIVTVGCASTLVYEDKSRKLSRTLHSGYRVVNLVSTASFMLADYGYSIYFDGISLNSDYDTMKKQLCDLQAEEDGYVANLLKSENAVDRAHWKSLADATHKKVQELTDTMGELSIESDRALSHIHRRNAVRLRNMCASNRGVYIKLGQHISMLDHIIPREYQEVLSSLLANNPRSSWESVRRVIQEELGAFPEELFDSFEKEPIASASLAQVYIAWKNGQKYAVKVQHEGLLEGATGDMAVITALVDLVPLLFAGFDYGWLTKEMNRNLPLELDFHSEVRNLRQCGVNLSHLIESGDLALPVPESGLSSRRVLTMSFEEGCYVSDQDKVRAMGLPKSAISRLISRTFCEQIYRHGFVHCGEFLSACAYS